MPTINEVNDIEPIIRYTGTNGQDTYVYPFPIFDERDIVVDIDGIVLTLNVDYTVTGVTEDNGGTIVLSSATSGGEAIVLYRDTPIDRLTDYVENGDFLADTVNNDFDRIILMLQELKSGPGGIERALRVGINDATLAENLIIPDISGRAGKVLGFDLAGKAIAVENSGGGTPILDLLNLHTIKLTSLGAVDNTAIDAAMAQAISSFSSISFDGLTNVWLDNPITIPDTCNEWLLSGCTLTCNVEQVVFEADEFSLDLQGGKLLGGLKYARLTADALPDTNVLTVDDSSMFTPTTAIQPVTDAFAQDNYVASGADNINMPNANSRAITNGGYNLVRASTPTTLTLDINILQGQSEPLRAGTYVGNWTFNSVGLAFKATQVVTIKNGTLGNWRGYIAGMEESYNDSGTKEGNFTLENIDLEKTGLDCFRFAGHTFLLDRVRLASGEQLDVYKQFVVSTWNPDGAIIFRNCDVKRHDHDADIIVIDTVDGISPTTNGSVLYENSVFDGSWDGKWGNPGEKNGLLSQPAPQNIGDDYQLHSVVPFNSENTFVNLLAKGTRFLGLNRSVFGTTFVAKDVYDYEKCAFYDCEMTADPIYVDVNGESSLDIYNRLICTVVNSSVQGKAFSLNFSVNTTYQDCDLYVTDEYAQEVGFIAMSFCRVQGGRLRGRFKIVGTLTQLDDVTIPRTDGTVYVPLIGDNYFGTADDTVILEDFTLTEAGFIDVSKWIVPNSGQQPSLPAFNMLNEINGAVMQWGNEFAQGPFYKVELLAQDDITPPASVAGRFFQNLPNNSAIFNTTEKTKKFLTLAGTANPIKTNVTPTSTQITYDKQFTIDIAPTQGDLVALINIEDSLGNPNPDIPSTVFFYVIDVVESGIEVTVTLDRPLGFNIKNDDTDWTDNGYEFVYVYHVWGQDLAGVPFKLLNPIQNNLNGTEFDDIMNYRIITFDDAATGNIAFDDNFRQGFVCEIVNLGAGGCSIGTTGANQISGNTTPASNEMVRVRKVSGRQWIAGTTGAPITGIETPSITTPSEGGSISSPTAGLVSSAFSATGGITHASSNWQVATDLQFNNVVFESLTDAVNLTSITATGLPGDSTVYIRVEYVGNGGELSGYSFPRTATTTASGAIDDSVGEASSYTQLTGLPAIDFTAGYAQDDKLVALIGGQAGRIFKAINQTTFSEISSPVSNLFSVYDLDGADDGSVIFVSGASGVFRSTNGGSSWTASTGINYNGFTDVKVILACDSTGQYVQAILAQRGNSPGTFFNESYYSTDFGVSFTQGSDVLTNWGVVAEVHIAKNNQNVRYVVTEGTSTFGGQVFKSANGGVSWTLPTVAPDTLVGQQIFTVTSNPNGQTVYVGCNTGRIFKSTDSGSNYTEILVGLTTTGIRSSAFSRDEDMIAFGVGSGEYIRSFDGGINFTLSNLTTGRIRTLTLNSNDNLMYALSTNGKAFVSSI